MPDEYKLKTDKVNKIGFRESFADVFIEELSHRNVRARKEHARHGGFTIFLKWDDINQNLMGENVPQSEVRDKIKKDIVEPLKNEGRCPHPNEHEYVTEMEKSSALNFSVSIPLKGGFEFGGERTKLVLACKSCELILAKVK